MEKGKVIKIYGGTYRVVSLEKDGVFVVPESFVKDFPMFPNPVFFIDAETIEKEGEVL